MVVQARKTKIKMPADLAPVKNSLTDGYLHPVSSSHGERDRERRKKKNRKERKE